MLIFTIYLQIFLDFIGGRIVFSLVGAYLFYKDLDNLFNNIVTKNTATNTKYFIS